MWVQYTEGLPRFKALPEAQLYFFDTTGDPLPEIEAFYEEFLRQTAGEKSETFHIGPEYAAGLHCWLDRIRASGRKLPVAKVQVTGPLSFALTVTDETRKPIFFHPLFKDVAVKGVVVKALWLIEAVRALADRVLVFVDEPILSAYGSSAMMTVSRNDVVETLDEVFNAIWEAGAVPGVHCCGNTDWGMLAETVVGVINFDAVDYAETLAIFGPQLDAFLKRGGVLAWGAVPNTPLVENEHAEHVWDRIRRGMGLLEASGVDRDRLLESQIITPACGCAGLSPTTALRVYTLLAELEKEGPTELRAGLDRTAS
jgi:hypothetical protein